MPSNDKDYSIRNPKGGGMENSPTVMSVLVVGHTSFNAKMGSFF